MLAQVVPRLLSQTSSRLLTLSVILIGWIFFRAQNLGDAWQFLSRIFSWNTGGTRLISPFILAALAGVGFIHLLIPKDRNWAEEVPQTTVPMRILAYSSLLILIVFLAATDAAPFIYFQF